MLKASRFWPQEELRLTELNSRVGRRECSLCHAPVEDVTVAIIRVEEGGEVSERNTSSWRAEPNLACAPPTTGCCPGLIERTAGSCSLPFADCSEGPRKGEMSNRSSVQPLYLSTSQRFPDFLGKEGRRREGNLSGVGLGLSVLVRNYEKEVSFMFLRQHSKKLGKFLDN